MRLNDRPKTMALTLRVASHLLRYPDRQLRAQLPELRAALGRESALSRTRRDELCALIDFLRAQDPFAAEAAYVELFDRGRTTSLHLFEHVHGDSRERGPALVDLARTYAQAGLYLAPDELPDYLPVVLEFASTLPATAARAFLGEMAHLFNALVAALTARRSRYACVLGALLDLAGERAQPIPPAIEEPLDATWEEPPAFGGCGMSGQSAPSTVAPLHYVPRARTIEGEPA
ncbi:MAG: nitrate reductase molybdenum cofactor assembly chaperone [Gammaproteobacteria bacterium]